MPGHPNFQHFCTPGRIKWCILNKTMKKSEYSIGFPEKAADWVFGWGVGNIHKPHHAFKSCLFGNLACQHANHPSSKSQPNPKSVWTPLNWKFSKNIPKCPGQQFLTGFCHWLPRRPISSAPGSTSGTAVGKKGEYSGFSKGELDLSPAQELEGSSLVFCPKIYSNFYLKKKKKGG